MTLNNCSASSLRSMLATIGTEYTARVRQKLSHFRLLVLVMLCAAMVPSPNAGYSILHINGIAPKMSSDTALQASAVVFGIIALFVFGLMLDVGRRRDLRQQLHPLFANHYAQLQWILLGRCVANLIYAHTAIAIAAFAISTTLLARYGVLPTSEAFAMFALIVSPAVITAVLIGMLVDILLPEQIWLRLVSVFVSFSALLVLAMFSPVDIVGISVLKQLIGNTDVSQELAIGFIKSDSSTGFNWLESAMPLNKVMLPRFSMIFLFLGIAITLTFLLGPILARKNSQIINVEIEPELKRTVLPRFDQNIVKKSIEVAHLGTALAIVFIRIIPRSKLALVLLFTAFLVGLMGGATSLALTLILFVPFILFSNIQTQELRVAETIEKCEPALTRFGNHLMVFSVIFIAMFSAAIPSLLRLELPQAVTAFFGAAALTAWLVWTLRIRDFQVFGVSLAGIVLYANVFNDIPPMLDIMGLWYSNLTALVISILTAISTVTMLISRKI